MANRRMFAKEIIDSDNFLDMPQSTQNLYFHLGMRADDDGFVNNPKKIQRVIGASDDDGKILLLKNYIISFETGIIVIKHWKMHNYLRKDRYKSTINHEEASKLYINKTGEYNLQNIGIPLVDQRLTQCSVVKSSVDKVSIDKSNSSVVLPQNETITTTIPQEFSDYFSNSKNIDANVNDEYEKFKLYNTDISRQTLLNWRRWVDKIKTTSSEQTEKQDYKWIYKKLESNSESIVQWYFNKTQQQLPTFTDFDFEEFKEHGISCVKLEHPSMDKRLTIYYKLGGDGEKILKKLGNIK